MGENRYDKQTDRHLFNKFFNDAVAKLSVTVWRKNIGQNMLNECRLNFAYIMKNLQTKILGIWEKCGYLLSFDQSIKKNNLNLVEVRKWKSTGNERITANPAH